MERPQAAWPLCALLHDGVLFCFLELVAGVCAAAFTILRSNIYVFAKERTR